MYGTRGLVNLPPSPSSSLQSSAAKSTAVNEALLPVLLLLRTNAVAAAWFLRSLAADPELLARRLYGEGSSDDVRNATANLAAVCIRVLVPLESAGPSTPEDAAALAAAPPALHAGALVDWFMDTLLDALPRLHRHWLRFSQYFQLLSSTCNLAGPPLRAILLRKGAIGRLVDFALCGRSPHPELNDPEYAAALALLDSSDPTSAYLAATATPAVRTMGSDYRVPDFSFLIRALSLLTLSSASLAGLTDGPASLAPQLPLSRVDADMLSSRQFLHAMSMQLSDASVVPMLAPLIHHLLWGASLDSWTPPTAAEEAALAAAAGGETGAPSAAQEADDDEDDDEADEEEEEDDDDDDAPEAPLAVSVRLEVQLPLHGAHCIIQVCLGHAGARHSQPTTL